MSVDFSGGKKHDFTLFKATHKIVSESTLILADRGYQGIAEFHKNTLTPIKKFNNKELVLQKKATTK